MIRRVDRECQAREGELEEGVLQAQAEKGNRKPGLRKGQVHENVLPGDIGMKHKPGRNRPASRPADTHTPARSVRRAIHLGLYPCDYLGVLADDKH